MIVKLGGGFIESMMRKAEAGTADESWIPLYASRGYVVLSCHRRQMQNAVVARTVAASGAKMVYLASAFADMKRWDQALWILRHWWTIKHCACEMAKGELVVFSKSGKYHRA